jgi:hypothetical protein
MGFSVQASPGKNGFSAYHLMINECTAKYSAVPKISGLAMRTVYALPYRLKREPKFFSCGSLSQRKSSSTDGLCSQEFHRRAD